MQFPGLSLASVGFGAAALAMLSAGSAQAQSQTLYRLETQCSLNGGSPQACVVEAVQEGDTTLYRHTVGRTTQIVSITDAPVRMAMWNSGSKRWDNLSSASARFSTNTICFNGQELCAVNANYLNSIREERPDASAGRDLIQVRFDASGRVNVTCYDDGCQELR
jgi:hypothetical protein